MLDLSQKAHQGTKNHFFTLLFPFHISAISALWSALGASLHGRGTRAAHSSSDRHFRLSVTRPHGPKRTSILTTRKNSASNEQNGCFTAQPAFFPRQLLLPVTTFVSFSPTRPARFTITNCLQLASPLIEGSPVPRFERHYTIFVFLYRS